MVRILTPNGSHALQVIAELADLRDNLVEVAKDKCTSTTSSKQVLLLTILFIHIFFQVLLLSSCHAVEEGMQVDPSIRSASPPASSPDHQILWPGVGGGGGKVGCYLQHY